MAVMAVIWGALLTALGEGTGRGSGVGRVDGAEPVGEHLAFGIVAAVVQERRRGDGAGDRAERGDPRVSGPVPVVVAHVGAEVPVEEDAAVGDRAVHSIRAIAARVGINSATLYAHYPSKAHVLAEFVLIGHRELHVRLTAAVAAHTSPPGKPAALVHAHVLLHADYPLLAVATDSELHALPAELAAPALELRDACPRLLLDVLERGTKDGDFHTPDPVLAATAIGGMGMRVAHWFDPVSA